MEKTEYSTKVGESKKHAPGPSARDDSDNDLRKPFAVRRPQTGVTLQLRELYEYHELIYFLIWRDIKVRYKQTVLGVIWVVLQPLLTMGVFTIFFGNLAKIPSDGVPYPIFSFAALVPWQLFANALSNSSNSLVNSRDLITKVYFPRLIIPLSSILGGLLDFAIALGVLFLMMLYYGIMPTSAVFLLPLFILLAIATALAVSLWLSALNVMYRDVRYTIPFMTQFWLFLTPIAYPSSLVPEKWRVLYGLNPMSGVVEGFRWALLGKSDQDWTLVGVSSIVVVVLLAGGIIYFRHMERRFADVV